MYQSANDVWSEDVQAALNASCAALLALQGASDTLAGAGEGFRRSHEAEQEAMELVRQAIGELRRQIGQHTASSLALGFVRGQSAGNVESPEGRPSSLRIA
jgi:hypothetical protein